MLRALWRGCGRLIVVLGTSWRVVEGAKRRQEGGTGVSTWDGGFLTTITSLRLAATPPRRRPRVLAALSQVRLVGELLSANQGRRHHCHRGGGRR